MEDHLVQILFQIFVLFTAAKLFAVVGERYKVPAVIAEIVAGILIGPHALKLVKVEDWTLVLAELGAIMLLFDVGLEQDLAKLLRVGRTALRVALLGVVVPFFLGYGLLLAFEHGQAESIFVGAAMVATSVGITARILQDMGELKSLVATVILGAAVIDDILAMIALAVASSFSVGVNYAEIVTVAALAIGFTLFVVFVGERVVRRVTPRVRQYAPSDPIFSLAMIICLGLSLAAAKIKIAAIIGAFLAGLVFSEETHAPELRRRIRTLNEFLVPFFFVVLGAQMDLSVLARGDVLLLATLVTLLAIVGKLGGCGLGAYSIGWRGALTVGVGMVPRGEVGLIVAAIGLRLGAISNEIYAVVIIMVLVTTLLAPPALKMLFAEKRAAAAPSDPPSEIL
ncbi:MAG: cation:proton antiporter [Terriglobia bacterium]